MLGKSIYIVICVNVVLLPKILADAECSMFRFCHLESGTHHVIYSNRVYVYIPETI